MLDCAFQTYKEARKRNENRKFDNINSKNFIYIIQVPIGSEVGHGTPDQGDPRIEPRWMGVYFVNPFYVFSYT